MKMKEFGPMGRFSGPKPWICQYIPTNGIFRLHGKGTGTGTGTK